MKETLSRYVHVQLSPEPLPIPAAMSELSLNAGDLDVVVCHRALDRHPGHTADMHKAANTAFRRGTEIVQLPRSAGGGDEGPGAAAIKRTSRLHQAHRHGTRFEARRLEGRLRPVSFPQCVIPPFWSETPWLGPGEALGACTRRDRSSRRVSETAAPSSLQLMIKLAAWTIAVAAAAPVVRGRCSRRKGDRGAATRRGRRR